MGSVGSKLRWEVQPKTRGFHEATFSRVNVFKSDRTVLAGADTILLPTVVLDPDRIRVHIFGMQKKGQNMLRCTRKPLHASTSIYVAITMYPQPFRLTPCALSLRMHSSKTTFLQRCDF